MLRPPTENSTPTSTNVDLKKGFDYENTFHCKNSIANIFLNVKDLGRKFTVCSYLQYPKGRNKASVLERGDKKRRFGESKREFILVIFS